MLSRIPRLRPFLAQAAAFNLLTLYEQRINRNVQRNMKLLKEFQTERKKQHNHAMEEAKILAQLNLMNGLPYQPEENGFVFSAAEINRAIDRDNRLKAAKLAAMPPAKQPATHQSPIARAA